MYLYLSNRSFILFMVYIKSYYDKYLSLMVANETYFV